MKRIKELTEKLGKTRRTIQLRADALGLPRKYQGAENGMPIRVFTDEEAEFISNYKGQKPGRKPVKSNGK